MNADQFRRIAYQKPFQPFRVRLTSGESLEIRRTLRTTVLDDRIYFGVDEDPATGIARRFRIVPMNTIAELQCLAAS